MTRVYFKCDSIYSAPNARGETRVRNSRGDIAKWPITWSDDLEQHQMCRNKLLLIVFYTTLQQWQTYQSALWSFGRFVFVRLARLELVAFIFEVWLANKLDLWSLFFCNQGDGMTPMGCRLNNAWSVYSAHPERLSHLTAFFLILVCGMTCPTILF